MSIVANTPESNLEWQLLQVCAKRNVDYEDDSAEAETVSALEFNESGELLAVGDRSGKIAIYERGEDGEMMAKQNGKQESNENKSKPARTGEYSLFTEFESHRPEFDYLKSLEIEEKINKIRWCRRQNKCHFLLSTNDKTIKLWKIYEKKIKHISNYSHFSSNNNENGMKSSFSSSTSSLLSHNSLSGSHLSIPSIDASTFKTVIVSTPRRVYANAHAYHINSISLNSDEETYISSDDLRINLWNLNISETSFNIVDIKPPNMEELTEVITSAEFHPFHCNLFMYSSSKGTIRLVDMRSKALCDGQAKVFEELEDQANKSFFSEMISSIADIKFSKDGRFILSRDYMTLKVWDVNMESKPVKTIHIHDHLRPKLCDLYENDCIFDKFECAMNKDGNLLLTGSYHNYFHIYDRNSKFLTSIEATPQANPHTNSYASTILANSTNNSNNNSTSGKGQQELKTIYKMKTNAKKSAFELNPDNIDFTKKALHLTWHPLENVAAVGADNKVFLFQGVQGENQK